MEEKKKEKLVRKPKKLKAKKDWLIVQNDFRLEIKKGDEVEVPSRFLESLKTENVI